MTNREDFAQASGLNAERGLSKNKSHYMLNHQLKDDESSAQDGSKVKMKKLGLGALKMTKPTLEIYRPPKNMHKNGAKVHFQSPPNHKGSPTPQTTSSELKSALKRSKSFAGSDTIAATPVGFDRDVFPLEYQGLIRNAMLDPNLLSCRQLMELVRLICSKAVESTQNAEPAAQMCFAIIEKETGTTFLESLLNACREWFNERDKLLRCPFAAAPNAMAAHAVGGSKRWTAYVSFLTELYLHLKSQHHQSVLNHSQKGTGEGNSLSASTHHALALLNLLYDCSFIILKPPAVNNVAEVECLRSMLITVGKQLEKDAPQRMQHIMISLRDAFVNPSVTAQIRKTVLELVELHASNWQLDLSQSVYYFPYTSVERR